MVRNLRIALEFQALKQARSALPFHVINIVKV
jgi:hypothetical protein